jgi:hypothetical protein
MNVNVIDSSCVERDADGKVLYTFAHLAPAAAQIVPLTTPV